VAAAPSGLSLTPLIIIRKKRNLLPCSNFTDRQAEKFRVAVVRSEKLVAEAGESSEGEPPPLEADTKQRLVKTEKALCVMK
jgi:hypothetical protein